MYNKQINNPLIVSYPVAVPLLQTLEIGMA